MLLPNRNACRVCWTTTTAPARGRPSASTTSMVASAMRCFSMRCLAPDKTGSSSDARAASGTTSSTTTASVKAAECRDQPERQVRWLTAKRFTGKSFHAGGRGRESFSGNRFPFYSSLAEKRLPTLLRWSSRFIVLPAALEFTSNASRSANTMNRELQRKRLPTPFKRTRCTTSPLRRDPSGRPGTRIRTGSTDRTRPVGRRG
jgi:hypothetical protein